ncbi:MAG: hypothetical protein WDN48_07170 [Pseudolabrys sp.]
MKIATLGAALLAASLLHQAAAGAVELDAKAVVYQLPDQIKWGPVSPAGNQQAVLFGDPTKPGLYGVLTNGRPAIISASRISIPTIVSSPCCPARGGLAAGPISTRPMPACRCPPALSLPITASRCTGTAPRTPTRCC